MAEEKRPLYKVLVGEGLFVVALAIIAAGFVAVHRVPLRRIPSIVNGDLLFTLFALLIAVELLRESNLLEHLVAGSLGLVRGTRTFTLVLIAITGLMAALLTNDVALFVVIPFTVAATRVSDFGVRTAVVLEVLAANLIGCLTPLGNPQNLYIFHASRWNAGRFVMAMLPFVVLSAIAIAITLLLLIPKKAIESISGEKKAIDRVRATAGVLCFALVVLVVARALPAGVPAAVAFVAAAILLRHRLEEFDLTILPIFFFAFIIVEGLKVSGVYALFRAVPIVNEDLRLYVAGVAFSQVISNVPATILLAPLTSNWRLLLYAVNAGGCGTIIASLANLLGWRIYVREHGADRAFLRELLLVNAAFAVIVSIAGWILLRTL